MDRRNFFKLFAALPFLNWLAAVPHLAPDSKRRTPHRATFTLKQRGPVLQVKEGERIKLPGTDEIFFVKSVTHSSDRFGHPVKVIKIDTP